MVELSFADAPYWAKRSWEDQAPLLGVTRRVVIQRAAQPLMERAIKEALNPVGPTLVRGSDLFSYVPLPCVGVPARPILLDWFDGRQVPTNATDLARLRAAARVVCYSASAFDALRDRRVIRLRRIPGPYMKAQLAPPAPPRTVGILSTCSQSSRVAAHLVQHAPEGVTIYAAVKVPRVTLCETEEEVVLRSQVLFAPQEDIDQGGPAWGGVVATVYGRPIATTPTYAFSLLSYPQGSYLFVPRRSPVSWWTALERYELNPEPFHRKPIGGLLPKTTRDAFLEGL